MAKQIAFGWHAVESLLSHDAASVLEIWLQQGRRDRAANRLRAAAETAGIAVQTAKREALDRLTDGARHQGVAAHHRLESAGRPQLTFEALCQSMTVNTLVLVLDGVQDPRNLGACMRSACAASATAVLVPKRRGVGLTPAARKTASGAADVVPLLEVTNLVRAMVRLQEAGLRFLGATMDAPEPLFAHDLTGPIGLVLGGEEKGLRRLSKEHCDLLGRVPMDQRQESLNVSVVAGIGLYEICRQRALRS